MAEVKPLKLKQERVQLSRKRASIDPYVLVLVEHHIVHLDQIYEYEIPEDLSDRAIVGALVEVEFGHSLQHGVITERSSKQRNGGVLKSISKVLSTLPYIRSDQLQLMQETSVEYGCSPWDLIKHCVPPYSKSGEGKFSRLPLTGELAELVETHLPESLLSALRDSKKLACAIESPTSTPYWEVAAEICLERLHLGSVLLLVPNERELNLLEQTFRAMGLAPIAINTTAGKSERYLNYLRSRSESPVVILGTRSSALLSLNPSATIVLLDDVDESHYERQAPTWNTRKLVQMREVTNSVIYLSATISLEIAQRITEDKFPLYRFPQPKQVKFHTTTQSGEEEYFAVIRSGLVKGSVLVSLANSGYITAFSCQKCRNIALCSCGGKLYLPSRNAVPRCATCATQFLEWSCPWCQGSQPRAITRGVHLKAEEFGRAFPGRSIITSSAQNPVSTLPTGSHIVLSTPGVEPRGHYAAELFLDLEGRLLRTTLRAKEELRYQIMRNLTMLIPGGSAYLSLQPSDHFLQTILRSQPLLAAEREIEERKVVQLPPSYAAILISGEELEPIRKVLESKPAATIVGPFLRAAKKTLFVKVPRSAEREIIQILQQVNRVQSMRREPLLTYQIDPYSLN